MEESGVFKLPSAPVRPKNEQNVESHTEIPDQELASSSENSKNESKGKILAFYVKS